MKFDVLIITSSSFDIYAPFQPNSSLETPPNADQRGVNLHLIRQPRKLQRANRRERRPADGTTVAGSGAFEQRVASRDGAHQCGGLVFEKSLIQRACGGVGKCSQQRRPLIAATGFDAVTVSSCGG